MKKKISQFAIQVIQAKQNKVFKNKMFWIKQVEMLKTTLLYKLKTNFIKFGTI